MSDRYTGMANVEFDFEAAEALVSAATDAAEGVRNLQQERTQRAATAQTDFQGYFAKLFADNVSTGTVDAQNLATCLDNLASYTSELITAAQEENVRRQHAREWAERQKAREENLLVDIYYNIAFWESRDPQPHITNDAPSYSAGDVSLARQELPTRGGGGGGGTSSADPENLRIFGMPSKWYTWFESNGPSRLSTAWSNFVAGCKWGTLDASSTVAALGPWIQANKDERAWANAVAAAFEAAGSNGGTASVSDASLLEALAQAGLDPVRGTISLTPPELQGVNPTTGYSNDPVNTATGNFIEPETDLSFPGASATLQLTRMYNSQSRDQGLFGLGWVSSLETRVLLPRVDEAPADAETPGRLGDSGAGEVALVLADGRQVRFCALGEEPTRAETDNFWIQRCAAAQSPGLRLPDGSEILVRNNEGGWWAFSADGALIATGSGPGTAVIALRDSSGRVVELVHERGRSISIEYAGDLVSGAVASDGRRIEYSYDEHGRLTGATDAAGTRSYRWNDDDLISAVVSAAGVVEAENVYDGESRVIKQTTEFGREVRFAYLPGRVTSVSDADGTNSNTWVADRRGRLTGVIDSDGERVSMSYDRHGNRTSVTDRDGSRTESSYDERGRLTLTRLPDGGEISASYDEFDRVVTVVTGAGGVIEYGYANDFERNPSRIVDAGGGVTELTWSNGLLSRVVDPEGVRIDMAYDEFGELVSTTNAAGDTARLERDLSGRVVTAVSPSGNRTAYRYDPVTGLLAERRDADGAEWRFEYGAAGKIAAVTDPLGGRITFEYGAHGQLVRTIDQLGRESSREFDPMGNVSSMHLPDGADWLFEHDGLSRLRRLTDPEGNAWSAEYDELGRVREAVSPEGVSTRLTRSASANTVTSKSQGRRETIAFDEFDRPRAAVADDGSEQLITYDQSGRPVELVDADGGLTVVAYDLAGRVSAITSPAGRTVSYTYDACGRLETSADAGGARTRYEYNADSLVSAIIDPTGAVSRFGYDACGRLVRREVPGEGVSRTSYDLLGRVVFSQDARFGQRRFSYDAAGQPLTAVNGLGGATRYEHDELGRLVAITDPNGGVTRREYDRAGRVVAITDPLGRTTRATYDADGRQLTQTDPAGRTTEWRYDNQDAAVTTLVDGVVTSRTSRRTADRSITVVDSTAPGLTVTHSLRFDRRGRLVERARDGQAIRWEYDADGLRAATIDPNGIRTEYVHDAAGRLVAARRDDLGEITYEYDAFGRMIAARTGDSQQVWEYENGFPVKHSRIDTNGVRSTVITRDENGRVQRIQDGAAAVEYRYDEACQLISAISSEVEHHWSYDLAGRLVSERTVPVNAGSSGTADTGVDSGSTLEFDYDDAGQLLATRGADLLREYTYDALGRRTSETDADGQTRFTWDSRGWLSSVTTETSAGERSVSLWVDALGELARVGDAPVWWDTASRFPSLISTGDISTFTAPGCTGFAAAAPTAPAAPTALDSDGDGRLGSPSASNGAALAGQWFEGGWRSSRNTALGDPWRADSTTVELTGDVSITATGGIVIAGLEWMGARVYDPAARGFLSVDPLSPIAGAGWAGNPYSFAGNDPLHALDPLGLRPVTDSELREYAASRQGALAAATAAVSEWWNENWEYVAAGAMIVGGVALMFTGVGGPAGIALMAGSGALLAGGVSTVSQKAQTGEVDWGQVGVNALIGGVTGAAGGAGVSLIKSVTSGGASMSKALLVNAGVNGSVGGASGGLSYLAKNDWQIQNGWDFAGSIAGGSLAGSVSGIGGPAAGSIALKFGYSSTGWQSQVFAAGFSGVGTSSGSVINNIVSGEEINWQEAAWNGVVGTGASGLANAAATKSPIGMNGVSTLNQMPYFHPRSLNGAFNLSQTNTQGLWSSSVSGQMAGAGADFFFGPEGVLLGND